jgi:glycosyltransferase involved in cell wall biosynthesis
LKLIDETVQVSIVIPLYNPPTRFPDYLREISDHLGQFRDAEVEIILVNDNPTNNGIREIVSRCREIRFSLLYLELMGNVGQVSATLAGLDKARGERIFTLDEDGEHPPSMMNEMLFLLQGDPRKLGVLAVPDARDETLLRKFGRKIFRLLNQQGKPNSSFRLITSDLRDALLRTRGQILMLSRAIWDITSQIEILNFESPKSNRKSNYPIAELIRIAVSEPRTVVRLVSNSLSILFSILSLGGLGSAAYFVSEFFLGSREETGFTTLVVMFSLSSTAIFLAISVMFRVFGAVMVSQIGPPPYSVRQSISKEQWDPESQE